MKKIISLIIASILMMTMVFAAGNQPENVGNPEIVTTAQPELYGNQPEDAGQPDIVPVIANDEEQEMAMEKAQRREEAKAKLKIGLENALTKVVNENARMKLQENLVKFEAKMQAKLERLEEVEIEEVDEETGEMKIKAKEPVKFFGFIKGKATKRFEIAENGTINEKAPWYRLFYSETEE